MEHDHLDHAAAPPGAWRDYWIGVGCEVFMALTLGQPIEVVKTHVTLHGRGEPMLTAARGVVAERGLRGMYAGLYPWAVMEALTGGCLLAGYHRTQEKVAARLDGQTTPWARYMVSHTVGGMCGGAVQGAACFPIFRMKVAEMSRPGGGGGAVRFLAGVLREHGVQYLAKGAHMYVLRQVTNWGSRIGMAKYVQAEICSRRRARGEAGCGLGPRDYVAASLAGGTFSCWNHPIEAVVVRLQAARGGAAPPGFAAAARVIYGEAGWRGFTRGLQTRLVLSFWATLCMVPLADYVRSALA
eukprot:TRINITY_DN1403_c1_g1_i1.p1 TRINITY_DN1403_c1_g1~~TRINITY_DN1403_c1_g1_i1.p1  ORF type:complete len:298 (+),score=91.52 TRINITY_DN1403_c1_g1_i1:60-953(+)